MATINKNLENLKKSDVFEISEQYLMGWHDLEKTYGFRIKGLNAKRNLYGLPALDKNKSMTYRIAYIQAHYSTDEIYNSVSSYLLNARVGNSRWDGIELLDCRFGGKEYTKAFRTLIGSAQYRVLSEKLRVQKLIETQTDTYGGVGLASDNIKLKAEQTVLQKYGVSNVMQDDDIKRSLMAANTTKYGGASPFCSSDVREKALKQRLLNTRAQMIQFEKDGIVPDRDCFSSLAEQIVFCKLIDKFGRHDVIYQYGIHPSDKRYPFNCDFYIKSLDLFIELNGHYSHHTHWYDCNNSDDILRRKNMLMSGKRRSVNAVHVWCDTDILKRNVAKSHQINYLVFWDGTTKSVNKQHVPVLRDFYEWFDTYDCNTIQFLNDYPNNTY